MEPAVPVLKKVDATDPAVWARITAMDAACFADGSPALDSNAGAWWIATVDGEDAAYCGIREAHLDAGFGYLCRAGVLKKFRGRGLQKLLIQKRLQHARGRKWACVVTDTHNNLASANSLIACGFRLYAPEIKWSFDTALYWRKKLA